MIKAPNLSKIHFAIEPLIQGLIKMRELILDCIAALAAKFFSGLSTMSLEEAYQKGGLLLARAKVLHNIAQGFAAAAIEDLQWAAREGHDKLTKLFNQKMHGDSDQLQTAMELSTITPPETATTPVTARDTLTPQTFEDACRQGNCTAICLHMDRGVYSLRALYALNKDLLLSLLTQENPRFSVPFTNGDEGILNTIVAKSRTTLDTTDAKIAQALIERKVATPRAFFIAVAESHVDLARQLHRDLMRRELIGPDLGLTESILRRFRWNPDWTPFFGELLKTSALEIFNEEIPRACKEGNTDLIRYLLQQSSSAERALYAGLKLPRIALLAQKGTMIKLLEEYGLVTSPEDRGHVLYVQSKQAAHVAAAEIRASGCALYGQAREQATALLQKALRTPSLLPSSFRAFLPR
jgi:hypothetical protein